jgi:dTDP-4-dehydrorhamnose reductase
LWGGAECTIVRLEDAYRDQAAETGHKDRRGDIDLMAELGVTTVRFPILWEAIAPDRPDRLDFAWTDDRLALLRERGIKVIGGLLHHGSGPKYTELLDPDFPRSSPITRPGSRTVIRGSTCGRPVNEPLTTARFSALYGHWYPHTRNYGAFLRALVNECKGTFEAMRAIREHIPGARLVQTEDLGKTFSTAPLRYQANHENERRWLSLDLLCGRVDERHPFFAFLRGAGVGYSALDRLATGESKPDILGINHYLTSERFPRSPEGPLSRAFPRRERPRLLCRCRSGPGEAPRGRYRLRAAPARGVGALRIPIAITEVHHGCHRDEQLRWFAEVWQTANQLRGEGMDLRAVTVWSMFGNVDWRFLLTRRNGLYDTGAFDSRSGTPRPTVIAHAAKAYAKGESFDHPALDSPGWWRRPPRLYPWSGSCKLPACGGRKLLITGATGTLGNAFARLCEERALPYSLTTRQEMDISDPRSIAGR